MSKGILMLAQNSEFNYVNQACLCALSILLHNPEMKISLVTNDEVPLKYIKYFDKIIPIPWNDSAEKSEWKIENRWKLYHVTPYEETIVMDTDMLVLQDITYWWKILEKYELYFVSNVKTYRDEIVIDKYYRKTFKSNDLPNIYTGFHYFKKCKLAFEFYYLLEQIVNNWELFYGTFVKEDYPKMCSIDISSALAVKILDIEQIVTNPKAEFPTFTHMKSKIQNWKNPPDSWLNRIECYINNKAEVKIGNHLQSGIFHYTEKEFVTDEILNLFEDALNA